jgi:electron transfer flavoprotein beta subunit
MSQSKEGEMNVYVFVKRVPDTESRIKIQADGKTVATEGLNFVLSPYDEYAVEEALRLKTAKGGKVTVFTAGSDESLPILRKCLAMGADEAVLIKDAAGETYDGLRTARLIAAALHKKYSGFDLLLFGKQAVGTDNSQVPSMVAELLGLPQANVVVKLEIEGSSGTAYREIEGAQEKVVFSLPAVISAQKGLNEPRYETLKGIMAAKKKEIPVLTPEALEFRPEDLSPGIEIARIDLPPVKQAGKVIAVEPQEAARRLVDFLRRDAKVI